jgi:putative flippase GtrA
LGPLLNRQFTRFLLVGVVNTAFSYLVYAALIFLGVNFALANLGAVVLGIVFSFKTQGTLVFNNPSHHLLLKYAVFWFVIYLCNIGLIKLLLSLGLNAYAAGALALPPIVLVSYVLQKYVVFKPKAQLDA